MPSNDFDRDDELLAGMTLNGEGREYAIRDARRERLASARRELRWFYTAMQGRVPAAGEAAVESIRAASRIAGWVSELTALQRGTFVLRYDGRRWPVRLTRHFGGLTSLVVRFAASEASRGPNETLAQAEEAIVRILLRDLGEHADREAAEELRRVRRMAQVHMSKAESAYASVRGQGPCVAPSGQGGA